MSSLEQQRHKYIRSLIAVKEQLDEFDRKFVTEFVELINRRGPIIEDKVNK